MPREWPKKYQQQQQQQQQQQRQKTKKKKITFKSITYSLILQNCWPVSILNSVMDAILSRNKECMLYHSSPWSVFPEWGQTGSHLEWTSWNCLILESKSRRAHCYDPVIPPLCTEPKKMKSVSWRDSCTPMATEALLTVAKIQKQPVSVSGWMEKEAVAYTHHGIFSPEKEGDPAPWNSTDGSWSHDTKWAESHRKGRALYDIAHRWHLKKAKPVERE